MSGFCDFHVHSFFSEDSHTPMEQMIQKAISLGLSEICFTEHMDMDYPVSPDTPEGSFLLNTDAYLCELLRLREKYASHICVLFGVELGLQPHLAKKHVQFVQSFAFDFIIASSHVCHKKDPYYPDFFAGRTRQEAYEEYFSSVLENIETFKNFDIYGHLDYVVRYGPDKNAPYTFDQYGDILEKILRTLIENRKGLELNTGGWRCGLKYPNPCPEILKRYRELGGEIVTLGSDAHSPEYIGCAFDRAANLLKSCGFRYYASFHHRQPRFHKL